MDDELSAVERRALALPPGQSTAVDAATLDLLLADPGYRPSLGQPGRSTHYRRSLPDGTGLHLVIGADGATLHRDRYDPHHGPAALLLHLATDSPREALSTLAAGWAALRRLGG